jgi:hypothetical protein
MKLVNVYAAGNDNNAPLKYDEDLEFGARRNSKNS